MGRKCSVVGCHSSVGLHLFPKNLEIRRQWLRAIGLGEDCKLPPHAGVCKLHFARNAFANSMEVEMGYASLLRLKSESVPTLALPRLSLSPPTLLPRQQDCFGRQSEPVTREIGCQTDPVIVRHASVQANVKPSRRSKAIQARSAYTSVSCGTGDLMEIPLPDSPRAASTPLKRKRCEVPASDPSSHMNCSSCPNDRKYFWSWAREGDDEAVDICGQSHSECPR